MSRLFMCVLVILSLALAQTQDSDTDLQASNEVVVLSDYEQGYQDGQDAALNKSLKSEYGCSCGIMWGCILLSNIAYLSYLDEAGITVEDNLRVSCITGVGACGIITISEELSSCTPVTVPIGQSAEYSRGYFEGYKVLFRQRKRGAIVLGSLPGFVAGIGSSCLYIRYTRGCTF